MNNTGYVNPLNGDVNIESGCVCPAFNLNLNSVLFTSASGTSKSSFASVGDSNKSANTWKLTLKDADTSFAATLPTSGQAGTEVSVTVTTAGSGSYNKTSAMLLDGNDTVVAYGSIGDAVVGEKKFTIPDRKSVV